MSLKHFILILILSCLEACTQNLQQEDNFSILKDSRFKKKICTHQNCVQVYLKSEEFTLSIDDSHLYDTTQDFIYPKMSVYDERPVYILVTLRQKSDILGFPSWVYFLTHVPVMFQYAVIQYHIYHSENPISNGILESYTPNQAFLREQLQQSFLQTHGEYCFSIPQGKMYSVPESTLLYYPVMPCKDI